MTVTNYAKKSRHGTAASSIGVFDIGQIVKPDAESVAPARSLASKSLRRTTSEGGTICGQSALSTNSERIEQLGRLQERYENDDGVSLFTHKFAVLRLFGGEK
ncbi:MULTISPECIES: hypothetical protein [Aeromonas]|uniref:Uncharacterized protein n=2 Tax=Aeromonas TaxID=642 RepID=A0AAX3VW42_AERSA|nr:MULTISPECIES: hypothetical protein [Aeromonas]USV58943.1 hypothetical protein NHF51_07345 [Aeromonas encheleia]WHF36842.1 hypothetical protein QLQ87_00295 [Aeromonas salmonicida]HEH9403985.1 hypothetical protein [Aeromonas bestiarum]